MGVQVTSTSIQGLLLWWSQMCKVSKLNIDRPWPYEEWNANINQGVLLKPGKWYRPYLGKVEFKMAFRHHRITHETNRLIKLMERQNSLEFSIPDKQRNVSFLSWKK